MVKYLLALVLLTMTGCASFDQIKAQADDPMVATYIGITFHKTEAFCEYLNGFDRILVPKEATTCPKTLDMTDHM